jgi:hypothetical protein
MHRMLGDVGFLSQFLFYREGGQFMAIATDVLAARFKIRRAKLSFLPFSTMSSWIKRRRMII